VERRIADMAGEDAELIPVELVNTWRCLEGKWEVSDDGKEFSFNGYKEDKDRSKDALYLNDISLVDGALEAEINVQEVVPHGTNAHLVFRFQDPENYLFAGLGGWDHKFVIAERRPHEGPLGKPGWQVLKATGSITDIETNQWHQLRVECSEHDINLYMGGIRVLSHTLHQPRYLWPSGNIGLRAWGLWKARFRNVRGWQRIRKTDIGPRLQQADLSVITDQRLRAVADKDLNELKNLKSDDTPKAIVVLCGSIAEAALLDYLARHESKARNCKNAPKRKNLSLAKWPLEKTIDCAAELGAIHKAYPTSHVLRNYRNWIHPGRPEAQSLEPIPAQAVAATECVLALLADLKP